MMEEGVVLGHYLSYFGIQVDLAKIVVITNLPMLTKQKNIRIFLGHASFYKRFIKEFSNLATLLYNLLKKEVEFEWIEDSEKAFQQLKDVLTTTPILRGPDWKLPFHIHTDASDTALGAILG